MKAPPAQLIILCATPHLDWDWLLPFPVLCNNQPPNQINYFSVYNNPPNGPAFSIFKSATGYLTPGGEPDSAYFYSICEMAFLRAFIDANPDQAALFQAAGANLEILGGGITSPDNLLPHGEAFLRTYLLGNAWARSILNLTPRQAWLPDDFGHDSQLPVMLAAMGFQGVAFERVPGMYDGLTPKNGSSSVSEQLTKNGVDFIWLARDGSTTVAHWLQHGYGQGSGLTPGNAISDIGGYITANQPSSPTPYLFVPVGTDFALPVDVPACVNAWNHQSPPPSVTAQAGTFDHFIQLLLANSGELETKAFYPQPYYTGCFQTRPLIKRMHYAATRALLGAEVFNTIAGYQFVAASNLIGWQVEIQGRAASLRKGWEDVAPSTHHDYITGTGIHFVYYGEQAPRLGQAAAGAERMRAQAMKEIAAQVKTQPEAEEQPVVVFNQLGISRSGLVELQPPPELTGMSFASVRSSAGNFPIQTSYEGGWLFAASVESLGYATCYLSPATPEAAPQTASIAPETNLESSYTLSNSFLEVQVSAASNWGIDSIYDLQSPNPQTNVLGAPSNQMALYSDADGTNYRYSNENEGVLTQASVEFTAVTAQVLETGPLRVRLLTRISCTVNKIDYAYTLEYILEAGEPFLRMRTTGACSFGYSWMTQFTMPQTMATLAHGTTYHWDDAPLVRYWKGPSMQATHDFVIPEDQSGAPMGAIFHGSMPAWGQVDETAVMVGGLARNPGDNYFGWLNVQPPPMGIDPDIHTVEYAFRVPTGISLNGGTDPGTGAQLIESMGYTTPLLAFPAPAATSAILAESLSLASVSAVSGDSQPIITAWKPAESEPNNLIVRIYQASNASMQVNLSLKGLMKLSGQKPQVTPVTGLEQPISGAEPIAPSSEYEYTVTANLALTTLLISPGE